MMFSSTLTIVQSSGASDDSLVLRPPALVRGLALCLLHSEAPTLGLLHVLLLLTPVDSRCLLGLCHPVSHAPDSSWDCRRVPSGHGLHSSQCTQLCKCFKRCHFSSCESEYFVLLPPTRSLFVRSESWGRLMCRQTTRHHLSALNHEVVLVLHSSLYRVKQTLSC